MDNFDWSELRWESPKLERVQGDPWRMNVAADWAPIRAHADLIALNPEAVYGDLLPVLRAGDWNLVNVEAVLGEAGEPLPKAGPNLAGDVRSGVACLQAANFHTACLANNHTFDFGVEGMRATMEALVAGGLDYVGAGFDGDEVVRPVFRALGGCQVVTLNCAEGDVGHSRRGEPGVNNLDVGAIVLQIAELKRSGAADVVVVQFHGGREFAPVPPPYVVKALRQIVEGGADAVIAHHPHVAQPIEIYRGVPIVYSQGNFVFWQEREHWSSHTGYLVHLDFEGRSLRSLSLTPYVIERKGLRTMRDDERAAFVERMERVSRVLESEASVNAAWAAFVDRYMEVDDLLGQMTVQCAAVSEKRADAWAAMRLFGRFATPAHNYLLCEYLDRYVKGACGQAPAWAKELVHEWFG